MTKKDIRFEYQGALESAVGETSGLTDAEWYELGREACAIVSRLNEKRGEMSYRDTPRRETLSQVRAISRSVARKRGRFDDVVVLGIGGSALGLTALRTALRPPYWNMLSARARKKFPRLWVMDNIDPDEFAAMLEIINPRRTLFNVISKSGETAETISQFLVVMDLVTDCIGKNWNRHVVITTDARRGLLRPVADAMDLESFVVPDGIGGRFSAMTPVGLFPAALIGIDVRGLLAGAAAMDKRCTSTDFAANLAAQGAAVQIGLYRKGKAMSVMMPYAAALRDVADWYRQLWAESLGKTLADGTPVGPTPIRALGVTDQHSQVQLYREGPADKIFTILSVEKFGCEVPIPDAPGSLVGFDYLRGHSMKELLKAEERATVWALSAISKRPTTEIILPQVTPQTVGGLLMMLMIQTSIAGEMLAVNTYNQPGVEAGKHAAMALMGKDGLIADPAKKGLPADCTSYAALRDRIQPSQPKQSLRRSRLGASGA